MATRYDSGRVARSPRDRTILDKLEKPGVAVPMILLSALVGLVLALLAVRAVDPRPIQREAAAAQDDNKAEKPRVDVRTAESEVLQPPRTAVPVVPPMAAARDEGSPAPTPPLAATAPGNGTRAPAAPAPAAPNADRTAAPITAPPAAAAPIPAVSQAPTPGASAPSPVAAVGTGPRASASPASAPNFGPSIAVTVPEPVRTPPTDAGRPARDEAVAPVPLDSQAAASVREVLHTAAVARQDGDVYAAASDMHRPRSAATAGRQADPALARRLNAAATRAFWERQDLPEALRLQQRAYAANPDDPEIAGNLAFYYLKQERADPRRAHDAAVQALTSPGSRTRAGRIEDWTSLGVANALMGHVTDARDAFLVTAAVSNDLDRVCRAGLNAVASYGNELRAPVTAMLYRIHQQGRSGESPYCAWPPNWSAGRRYP